jgi:phthiocerol/phenolphthiocerol synthesis type-I polyketide synthase E
VTEPIAIIGLACRLPGADDAERFWSNIREGKESITFLTDRELLDAGVPEDVVRNPNFVKAVPLLPDFDRFDARFFGMTPREARMADPQVRTFLEVAHSAVENAGYNPFAVPDVTGVFGAVGHPVYGYENLRGLREPANNALIATTNDADYLATQVSYRFNYTGPSMTVLTACSSSLTAVHLACQSLHMGDCDLALAGGVAIDVDGEHGYWFVPGSVHSPDGHCKPFDISAGGTVFGSGAGVVVLKRLADAVEDGDHIHAVIRGTAVNNDGSDKVGFGAPSVSGQVACIRDAMDAAGVRPRDISYVEAHGTGTALGDPIEVNALATAWQRLADDGLDTAWCPIGSVKSNIGHCIQAAGVAGLIKLVGALEHGEIPPTVNFSTPNPKLELDKTPFFVADRLLPWPRSTSTPRLAAISSLGAGGTNVHMIVGEGPAPAPVPATGNPRVITWSGLDDGAVDAAQRKLAGYFAAEGAAAFEESVATLQRGRRAYPERRAVVAAGAAEAAQALSTASPRSRVLRPLRDRNAMLAFAFPGQGSLYPRMGQDLCGYSADFQAAVDQCLELFGDQAGRLSSLLRANQEADQITSTAIAQPLLAIVEYALAQTLRSWGVTPSLVVGHSLGELVAGAVAGVFTPEDMAKLVLARADAMQAMPAGAMAAVFLPHEKVAERMPEGLTVAAVNCADETVVAGPLVLLEEFTSSLRGDGTRVRMLRTSHAFHSPSMTEAARLFERAFDGITLRPPDIPIVSAASGQLLAAEAVDPHFWASQLVRPVWFGRALQTLGGSGAHLLLEMGPGEILTGLARREPSFTERGSIAVPVLGQPSRDGQPAERRSVAAALGHAWVNGAPVDWTTAVTSPAAGRVSVPGYQYQRQRYWVEGRTAARAKARTAPDSGQERPKVTTLAGQGTLAVPSAPAAPYSVLTWVEEPRPERIPSRQGAHALVLLPPGHSAGLKIVLALRQAGIQVHAVRSGPDFAAGDSGFQVRSGHPADLRRVLDVLREGDITLDFVVHASTVEPWRAADADNVEEQLERSFFSLLELVQQACRAAQPGRLPSLLVLTSRSADVSGSEEIDIIKASLPAQFQTMLREDPQLRGRLVDVAPGTAEEELAAELGTPGSGIVALRGARRWVRREVPHPVRPGAVSPIRKNGVYLVTGGLGGLGLAVSRGLAGTGMRPTLILVGRRGIPDGAERERLMAAGDQRVIQAVEAIDEMTAMGATVHVMAANVADQGDLRRVTDACAARFGAINGVLHLAGIPGDGLLLLRQRQQAAAVLQPKVSGTLLLGELLGGERLLDFMVLFSSRASINGLVGSGDYAAGNAIMDAYATVCSRNGTRVLSINWPGWSSVGMAAASLADAVGQQETVTERTLTPIGTWALDEHRFNGIPVLPGTAHLDLVLGAFRANFPGENGPVRFRDVVFHTPLAVPEEGRIRIVFRPADPLRQFRVESWDDGQWRTHVSGRVGSREAPVRRVDLAALRDKFAEAAPEPQPLAGPGKTFALGPRWRVVLDERKLAAEKLLTIELPDEFHDDLERHPLHPTILDAATSGARDLDDGPSLPFMYGEMTLHGELPAVIYSHIRLRPRTGDAIMADIDLIDTSGTVVGEITGFGMRALPADVSGAILAESPAPVSRQPTFRAGPGLDPDTGVRLLLDLLSSATAPVVAVRPFLDGQPVPLAGTERPTEPGAASGADPGEAAPTLPDLSHGSHPQLATTGAPAEAAPTDARGVAAKMRAIWEETLEITDFGDDADFYELGGTSLSAIELVNRIRDELSVDLSIVVLLEAPTLAGMAAAVQAGHAA